MATDDRKRPKQPKKNAEPGYNFFNIYGTRDRNPKGTTYREDTSKGFPSFLNDLGRNFHNFRETAWNGMTGQKQAPRGGGLGDSMYGRAAGQRVGPKVTPANRAAQRDFDRSGTSFFDPFGTANQFAPPAGNKVMRNPAEEVPGYLELQQLLAAANQPQLSFSEALAQARDQVGVNRVSYDPQRQTARSNASEADARLEAMYRQLKGSIDADESKIAAAYTTARDAGNASAAQAQQAVQDASNAANARNDEVLANLGISDAQKQIIGEGRDLASQTARQVGDMGAKQQAAATNLSELQASGVQQNRSIGNAAALEGNTQRAQNQAKLQALLAQIDMKEQQDNQAAEQQAESQSMSLAQALMQSSGAARNDAYGRYQDALNRSDGLQQAAAQQAQAQQELNWKMNQPQDDPDARANSVNAWLAALKAGGTLDWEGMSTQDRLKALQVGSSLYK